MKRHNQILFAIVAVGVVGSSVVACRMLNKPESGPKPQTNVSGVEFSFRMTTNEMCIGGCPAGAAANDTVITHHILELSNNPDTKFADWVAYKITADTIGSHCVRKWEKDPDLGGDATLVPKDYTDIKAALQSDRGHQAPLASLCGSSYWQEADYLSNITPQKSDLNEGAWERLEDAERGLIGKTDTVYSVTGPLYEKTMPKLPHAHLDHRVPSGYWKIIGILDGDKVEAVAFVMAQEMPKSAQYCTAQVTIHEVEQRANLTFFPDLPAPARGDLEQGKAQGNLPGLLKCAPYQPS